MGLCLTKLRKQETRKQDITPIFPPHINTSHVIDHFVDKLPSRLQGEGIHLLRAGPGPIVQRWTHELLEDAGVHNYEDRALLLQVRDEMTAAVEEHRKRRRAYLLQLQQQEEQHLRRSSGAPSTSGGAEGGSGVPSPAAWRSIRRWSLGSLTSDTGAGETSTGGGGGVTSHCATVSVSSSAVSGDTGADAAEEDALRAAAEAAATAAADAAAANTAAWLDNNSDGKPFHLRSDWLPAGVSLYRISEEMRHAVSSGLENAGPERQFVSHAEAHATVAEASDAGAHEASSTVNSDGNGDGGVAAGDIAAAASDAVELPAAAAHGSHGVMGTLAPCSSNRGGGGQQWPTSPQPPRSPTHDPVKSRLGRRPSDSSESRVWPREDEHGDVCRSTSDIKASGVEGAVGAAGHIGALDSVPEGPSRNGNGNGCMAELHAEGGGASEKYNARVQDTGMGSSGEAVQGHAVPGVVTDGGCSEERQLGPDAGATAADVVCPLTPTAVGSSRDGAPWSPTETTTNQTTSTVPESTTTTPSPLFHNSANGGSGGGGAPSASPSSISSASSTSTSPHATSVFSPSAASCTPTNVTTTTAAAGAPSSRGLNTSGSTSISIGDDVGGSGSPVSSHAAEGSSRGPSGMGTMGNRDSMPRLEASSLGAITMSYNAAGTAAGVEVAMAASPGTALGIISSPEVMAFRS